jgi:protein arginine N-methyltransferase 1
MYSIGNYGEMIADRVRMDSYAYALKAAIRPDSVVLDIGTGAGIHALLACKFGARKVYAVEPNDAIHLAKELAQVNGFADRITFFQDVSTRISLPERADVIVSDLRGVLPLYGEHITSIIDARQRHLAPGGILIPIRDSIWVSVVEAPAVYKELTTPWNMPYGLSMNEAREIALNDWSVEDTSSFNEHDLLIEPQVWTVLDYASIESPNVSSAKIRQQATRNGTAHGLLLWFDGELADGITLFNGPRAKKGAEVYDCAFFPLLEAVMITKGDTITLELSADLIGGQYRWGWHTRIHSADGREAIKASFVQSTSLGSRMERAVLHQTVVDFAPSRSEKGEIDHFILGMMDGEHTIDQIARQAREKHPARFENQRQAQLYVTDLSQEYSR